MRPEYEVPEQLKKIFNEAYLLTQGTWRDSAEAGLRAVLEDLSQHPILPNFQIAESIWANAKGANAVYKFIDALRIWENKMFLKSLDIFKIECANYIENMTEDQLNRARVFFELGKKFKEEQIKN